MLYLYPAYRRHAPPRLRAVFLALCSVLCLALYCLIPVSSRAASTSSSVTSASVSQPPVKIQRGKASYLTKKSQGQATASGEKHHTEKQTAAHRTLPFGTVLRVTRLSNGRSVLVRVNDRGPFIEDRALDISHLAARKLNMLRGGVTTVQYEVISDTKGIPLRKGEAFYLVFETAGSAQGATRAIPAAQSEIPAKVRKQLPEFQVFERERDSRLHQYFVGMGPFKSFADAQAVMFRMSPKVSPDMICANVIPPRSVAAKDN